MRRDDFTIFCEKFKPDIYPEGHNEGGTMRKYHWKGEDGDIVAATPGDRIWTLVDCDGKMYITPGWHYVNRMDYIITEIPWEDGQRDYRY